MRNPSAMNSSVPGYEAYKGVIPYIPQESVPFLFPYLQNLKISLKVVNRRKTRFGDYRPPIGFPTHRISVNGDLNPYAFLLTLLHEIAHAIVWKSYKNRVKPHGKEWKSIFGNILQEALEHSIFPSDLVPSIQNYSRSPKASSSSDLKLFVALSAYDKKSDDTILFLENIPENHYFILEDGRPFQKLEKRNKNYKCLCLQSKKTYVISPVASVKEIEI